MAMERRQLRPIAPALVSLQTSPVMGSAPALPEASPSHVMDSAPFGSSTFLRLTELPRDQYRPQHPDHERPQGGLQQIHNQSAGYRKAPSLSPVEDNVTSSASSSRLSFPAPPSHEPGLRLLPHAVAPPTYDQSVRDPSSFEEHDSDARPIQLAPLVGPDMSPPVCEALPPIDTIPLGRPCLSAPRLLDLTPLDHPPSYHADSRSQPSFCDGSQSTHASFVGPPRTRTASVDLSDPNVRLACEGLQALCTSGELTTSASYTSDSSLKSTPMASGISTTGNERLATFLATRSTLRPWIDRYSAGKVNWSVIRPAVELMERGVTSAVDSVPRTPFVGGLADASVRYLLTPRRPLSTDESDASNERGAKRRRRVDSEDGNHPKLCEFGSFLSDSRRQSSVSTMESLPSYDDIASPAYTETTTSPSSRQWAERFVISTSGLGAAVDQRKLETLKRCLAYLRNCMELIRDKLEQVQRLLDRHAHPVPAPNDNTCSPPSCSCGHASCSPPAEQEQRGIEIRRGIDAIREQLRRLLHFVMTKVNDYAIGTIPESAATRILQAIEIIPVNMRLRNQHEGQAKDVEQSLQGPESQYEAGHRPSNTPIVGTMELGMRVRRLAQEMLSSLQRVAGIVEEAIVSAEGWCDTMGRRVPDSLPRAAGTGHDGCVLPMDSGLTPK